METTPATSVPAAATAAANWQEATLLQAASLRNQIKGGVSWFNIIAGVTVLNSVLYRANATITFVVGLGAGQVLDGISTAIAAEFDAGTAVVINGLGFGLSLAMAGVFLLCGWLARRGHRWAVVAGMFFYALDALLLLAFADWFGALFHGLALFGLGRAWGAMGTLGKLETAQNTGDLAAVQGLVLASGGAMPMPPAEPALVPRLLEPVSVKATVLSGILEPLYWVLIMPFLLLGLLMVMLAVNDFSLAWVFLALLFLSPSGYLLWLALTRRIEIGNDGVRYWEGRRRLFFPWAAISAVKIERPLKQITFWTHQHSRQDRIHEFGLPREELARVRETLAQQLAARRIPPR